MGCALSRLSSYLPSLQIVVQIEIQIGSPIGMLATGIATGGQSLCLHRSTTSGIVHLMQSPIASAYGQLEGLRLWLRLLGLLRLQGLQRHLLATQALLVLLHLLLPLLRRRLCQRLLRGCNGHSCAGLLVPPVRVIPLCVLGRSLPEAGVEGGNAEAGDALLLGRETEREREKKKVKEIKREREREKR